MNEIEKNLLPEHQRLVNNLLNISSRDKTLYISINPRDTFDLYKILTPVAFNKIFNKANFEVAINKIKDVELFEKLGNCEDYNTFVKIINENNIFISRIKLTLLKNAFNDHKQALILEIKADVQKFIKKWKRCKAKYLDLQAQTNSWPFYIGTFIIKLATSSGKKLYTPLLLKKVEIDISEDNKVKIKTLDKSIDLNEKLLFFLEQEYGFKLKFSKKTDECTFEELINECKTQLHDFIGDEVIDLKREVNKLTKDEIINSRIEIMPGIVLTTMSPSGGMLRQELLKILNTSNLDNFLAIDPLHSTKKIIEEKLLKNDCEYKITPADISQERAMAGAFLDHALIWGPPGTGKSQTIANILVNLLLNNKAVLVTSEKKAALDVIKERMGSLSKFMFFGLVDRNVNKQEFYLPFQKLILKLQEQIVGKEIADIKKNLIISQIEKNFSGQKSKLKNENIDDLINLSKIVTEKKLNINLSEKIFISLKEQRIDIDDLSNLSKIVTENNLDLGLLRISIKSLIEHQEIIEKIDDKTSLKKVLKSTGIKKSLFSGYSISIRKLIEVLDTIDVNLLKLILKIDNVNNLINLDSDILEFAATQSEFLKKINTINDVNNLINFNEYIENEKKYCGYKTEFQNNIEFLEQRLITIFSEKIKKLRNDDKYSDQVMSFLRNCSSGFRIPYKFITFHKEIISKLFNVLISTPQTLSNFIDWDKKYDYAVFDEASQLHLEKALPFIAVSKRCVIAGDNQQMQPTNFFSIRENISSEVKDESEVNVDSLLEYAERKGLKGVREYMLTKNYRSVYAELMNFSSLRFYNAELDVIDAYGLPAKSPIEIHNVGGEWKDNINEVEAHAVLKKLIEVKSKYDKIILLTLNAAQYNNILTMIYDCHEYKKIMEWLEVGEVYLRTLENIQGDEADCVIASVAYDKNARLSATYVARPEGEHALNVAISRAKEKMIVYKSINANEIAINNVANKSMITFKEWIEYLDGDSESRKNYLLEKTNNYADKDFDSSFEENVYNFLLKNIDLKDNLKLVTQYVVGSYRIDQAIINNKAEFIIGLEVDGYKYHSGEEKILKDIERQRFIEAKGYPIYRITELLWNIGKETIVKDINEWIIINKNNNTANTTTSKSQAD